MPRIIASADVFKTGGKKETESEYIRLIIRENAKELGGLPRFFAVRRARSYIIEHFLVSARAARGISSILLIISNDVKKIFQGEFAGAENSGISCLIAVVGYTLAASGNVIFASNFRFQINSEGV